MRVDARVFDSSRGPAQVVETHISTVAFDGDVAHKRKKNVRFAFVDLSTPERREAICQREVELNRRFSPDVYLGVEEVVDDHGAVIDHAVRMRRMPADRRLSKLVLGKADVAQCVRQVARLVAIAHAESVTNADVAAVATYASLLGLWEQNLEELEPFVPDPLDPASPGEVGLLAAQYLHGRTRLLDERIRRGCVLDGHGDLLADDIYCLDDGPRVLDCLEFDDRLRWGDVLYDVGFLAMDFERLGRADLASAFMEWYREFSAEVHPASLEHHYVAYRALVRAKISCLRGTPADQVEARAYLALCLRHLRAGQIRLVLVGGLPGTGKTTLASTLGDERGWPVLRSDELRKQQAGLGPLARATAPYKEGLYSSSITAATYAALLEEAQLLLEDGQSVIVDASFSSAPWRAAAATLASNASAVLVEVRCTLPSHIAADRLRERGARGTDASDADAIIARAMQSEFDEWPTATSIDTRSAPPVVAAQVRELLEPRRD
jgi:aminoglycoside phosphotransferase family enzyme/predicted kinase